MSLKYQIYNIILSDLHIINVAVCHYLIRQILRLELVMHKAHRVGYISTGSSAYYARILRNSSFLSVA